MSLKQNKNLTLFIGVSICVILLCVLFIISMIYLPWFSRWDMTKRGQLGDMFGVLGSLFSGLAFAGVIVTLKQQREDIELQKEELKRQRFEHTFFSMVEMHQSILRDTLAVKKNENGEIETEFMGRDALHRFNTWVQDNIGDNKEITYVVNCYNTLVFSKGRINPYFRLLFSIVEYVDKKDFLTKGEKTNYICMLWATLSLDEKLLLFYYGLSEEHKNNKELIERYSLFRELKREQLIAESHWNLYHDSAYNVLLNN